jgi:hypothetical protein
MANPILKQAVVIGAGMAGLAAAKAVTPHFEKVTVFDRDALPDVPAPRFRMPHARGSLRVAPARCATLSLQAGSSRWRRRKPLLQLESRFRSKPSQGDLNMKKQALTAIEIEALAPSNLTAPDEQWEPVSLDGEDYPSKPETRKGALRCTGLSTCWLSPAPAWSGFMLASGSTRQLPGQPDHRKTGRTG